METYEKEKYLETKDDKMTHENKDNRNIRGNRTHNGKAQSTCEYCHSNMHDDDMLFKKKKDKNAQ